MLFSSVAAVHGTALYLVQEGDTVDLDIIPVFAITVVGMLAAAPMFIWSKTLREAAVYVKIVLSAWVVLMMAGVIASCGSISQWTVPDPCNGGPISTGCVLTCNSTLPMRDRQSILTIPSPPKHTLSELSGLILSCGLPGALLSWVHLFRELRQNQEEMFLGVYCPCSTSRLRRWGLLLISFLAWASILFSCGLIVAQIVITEALMYHLPMSESMSAIGQWGPAVGAALALLGSLLKGLWKNSSTNEEPELSQDLESFRHKVFQEGAWWGQRAEGIRISCGNKSWVVQGGVLRQQDDLFIGLAAPAVGGLPPDNGVR